ncbi:MAG: cyclic pyranopterin phosphate synthase [Zhongshania sp.]|jgi:cyclic pyranopterin phosphate synthase
MINTGAPLQDRFGRGVEYLRLSVTDRCDFRCVYCMAEDMTFLPRNQILNLEQLYDIASSFVQLGVKKIRLTGGEPMVRNNVMSLIERLGKIEQLEQLHLTTNGAQLDKFAAPLKAAGLTGMNISLDSLQPARFKELTRFGDLKKVLTGIDAARDAGFDRLKLNAVILKGRNDDEILNLIDFIRDKHIDISFIEEMPLGNISEHDRALSFISSEQIRTQIEARYALTPTTENTGGPSRYYRMTDSTSRIGFISPHSNNFCHLCNRVRLTVEGRLLLCLGNEHSVSLKELVDRYPGDEEKLQQAIIQAMDLKPESHHFSLDDEPQIVRFMNTTGG